ncbi:MAG: hypothetical protein M3N53_04950 [Actinomycetota bacterium]|nr:hypothetical protein [Actinomycetota bacterium]
MLIRDQRGIIGDWIVKVVLGMAIFAVIAYDAGSILVNYFTLDSGADDVAIAVSLIVGTTGNAGQYTDEEIYQLAKAEVNSEDGGVEGARVLREGTNIDDTGVVHIRLRRTADSLIVSRIGPIAKWARATSDGQAGTT